MGPANLSIGSRVTSAERGLYHKGLFEIKRRDGTGGKVSQIPVSDLAMRMDWMPQRDAVSFAAPTIENTATNTARRKRDAESTRLVPSTHGTRCCCAGIINLLSRD
jgi:hypothetical protein